MTSQELTNISTSTRELWTDHVVDARGLHAVFGEERPEIDGGRLLSVTMLNRASEVSVDMHLANFPVNPPKKYRGSNVILISLLFSDVSSVDVRGWVSAEQGQARVSGRLDGREFSFESYSQATRLTLVSDFIHVSRITAYEDRSRETR